jgi:O-antigen biosynthesis protein WbqP
MYKNAKRIIDAILAFFGILFLSPLLILLALWVKLDSEGPVLFRQRRVGINKSHFMMLKYRTMRTDTPKDTPTHLLQNADTYITKSGAFLRKTSLDELPQLFNILRGEMSIVGPRPALWNQYDLISERDLYKANAIRPGLTGWAQINGRDELPIALKAKLDGEYVVKSDFIFDAKIIFDTFIKVLKSEGVKEGAEINEKNSYHRGK